MTRADQVLFGCAVLALWALAISVVVLFFRAIGISDRLARFGDRALGGPQIDAQRHADAREITTSQPHLRLVVDQVGADVDRDVFPTGDAA